MAFQPTKYTTITLYDGMLSDVGSEFSSDSNEIITSSEDFFQGDVIYKGLNQKNESDDIFLYNMDVIVQSFMNMIFTNLGERLFRPTFGASLNFALFAPINEVTSEKIRQLLFSYVVKWDPRIVVDIAKSRVTPEDTGYNIYMVYNVLGFGNEKYVLNAFYQIYESD